MKYVYLAGPIKSVSNNEIQIWRNHVNDSFVDGIKGISPFRCAELGSSDEETEKRIITKNFMDTQMCDGVLAYLPKAINDRRPSYGTTFEIAWAFATQKPCWIVTDDDLVRNHPLMNQSSMMFSDLDDAIDHINQMFGVY